MGGWHPPWGTSPPATFPGEGDKLPCWQTARWSSSGRGRRMLASAVERTAKVSPGLTRGCLHLANV